ncbi:class I SAM-dependent methyltransferase [Aspergillus melleus]|uniref:class I SAM-dependent methyltransferase n=1 Tax=Aspergillus melleus TaxID=138277 RepID=UPI001E8E2B7F|nr:uncharacterized protein LDX57_004379 [Aspergillus melleus]KAH8426646.1 hypothetical protein LDX57_004379 [Aspergillus melleus]
MVLTMASSLRTSSLHIGRSIARSPFRHVSPSPGIQRNISAGASRLHPDSKEDDSTNVWKLTQEDQTRYWQGYLSTRPKYTDSFYDLIYNYHASQSKTPSFDVAHDVGAGPGQVSVKLAEKYKHVVVSDNNENHVDYARYALSKTDVPAERFSYNVALGEELGTKYPANSADLVVCALMFPLMDTATALQSFRTVLKQNGTLAIWFYGRAHFSEPEYAETCQPVLDAIINHHFGGVIKGGGPEHTAGWKRAADGIASWLDYIPFAREEWKSVQRHKWNTEWTQLGFFGQDACNFPVEPVSKVQDGEVVIERQDRDLWRKDWNLAQLRQFVQHIFPFNGTDEEPVKPLWAELEKKMGGAQAQRTFSWPVVLVLASKK